MMKNHIFFKLALLVSCATGFASASSNQPTLSHSKSMGSFSTSSQTTGSSASIAKTTSTQEAKSSKSTEEQTEDLNKTYVARQTFLGDEKEGKKNEKDVVYFSNNAKGENKEGHLGFSAKDLQATGILTESVYNFPYTQLVALLTKHEKDLNLKSANLLSQQKNFLAQNFTGEFTLAHVLYAILPIEFFTRSKTKAEKSLVGFKTLFDSSIKIDDVQRYLDFADVAYWEEAENKIYQKETKASDLDREVKALQKRVEILKKDLELIRLIKLSLDGKALSDKVHIINKMAISDDKASKYTQEEKTKVENSVNGNADSIAKTYQSLGGEDILLSYDITSKTDQKAFFAELCKRFNIATPLADAASAIKELNALEIKYAQEIQLLNAKIEETNGPTYRYYHFNLKKYSHPHKLLHVMFRHRDGQSFLQTAKYKVKKMGEYLVDYENATINEDAKESEKEHIPAQKAPGELCGLVLENDTKDASATEFVFCFSGSKTANDWSHNLLVKFNELFNKKKRFSSPGEYGCIGLEGHLGIMSLFSSIITSEQHYLRTTMLSKIVDLLKSGKKITFSTTGHSLGGALSYFMAYWLKREFIPIIKQEHRKNTGKELGEDALTVKCYTYAAPPALNLPSAKDVENELGRDNITRVVVPGDPVPTLSVFYDENPNATSWIRSIAGFYHVGSPVVLYHFLDRSIRGTFIEPWKIHLMNSYQAAIWEAQEAKKNPEGRDLLHFEKATQTAEEIATINREAEITHQILERLQWVGAQKLSGGSTSAPTYKAFEEIPMGGQIEPSAPYLVRFEDILSINEKWKEVRDQKFADIRGWQGAEDIKILANSYAAHADDNTVVLKILNESKVVIPKNSLGRRIKKDEQSQEYILSGCPLDEKTEPSNIEDAITKQNDINSGQMMRTLFDAFLIQKIFEKKEEIKLNELKHIVIQSLQEAYKKVKVKFSLKQEQKDDHIYSKTDPLIFETFDLNNSNVLGQIFDLFENMEKGNENVQNTPFKLLKTALLATKNGNDQKALEHEKEEQKGGWFSSWFSSEKITEGTLTKEQIKELTEAVSYYHEQGVDNKKIVEYLFKEIDDAKQITAEQKPKIKQQILEQIGLLKAVKESFSDPESEAQHKKELADKQEFQKLLKGEEENLEKAKKDTVKEINELAKAVKEGKITLTNNLEKIKSDPVYNKINQAFDDWYHHLESYAELKAEGQNKEKLKKLKDNIGAKQSELNALLKKSEKKDTIETQSKAVQGLIKELNGLIVSVLKDDKYQKEHTDIQKWFWDVRTKLIESKHATLPDMPTQPNAKTSSRPSSIERKSSTASSVDHTGAYHVDSEEDESAILRMATTNKK